MRWSSAEMAQVVELVRDATGLVFPDARIADVEATIRRSMAKHAATRPGTFVALLRADARVREALVAQLTIGETYFQRDPAQLELLRQDILPALLTERPPDRPVRVWSAGCASGEEPYSVAMLFDELRALDRCAIIGTDIARNRLQDAQRGIYSRWSLRNTPPDIRSRYFRERGKFFELGEAVRKPVDFRYLNLAEDRFPSLSVGIWGMDVILCRNVLIYFDRETVREVARRLIATLSEDGWLILGASDPAIAEEVECDVVLTAAGVAYRRPGATGGVPAALHGSTATGRVDVDGGQAGTAGPGRAPAPPASPRAPLSADAADAFFGELADALADSGEHEPAGGSAAADEGPDAAAADAGRAEDGRSDRIAAAYRDRNFDRVVQLAQSAPAARLDEASWVAWIRAHANQGALAEAGRIAAQALELVGATAELLYLHGVLLLQAGRPADAASALRQALYLDRNFAVAHLTLADALQRDGNAVGARRSLRNAAALLDALPPDRPVPGADGEVAGRLRELVRVKLRLLSEAA
jgi:chemotaxis protein methyltransferase CheR